jgi:hypothetical protein
MLEGVAEVPALETCKEATTLAACGGNGCGFTATTRAIRTPMIAIELVEESRQNPGADPPLLAPTVPNVTV